MLTRLAAYKKKDEEKVEITAAGIDFTKPIDQQEEGEKFDPKKEITVFQTFCDACSAEGECKMCVARL